MSSVPPGIRGRYDDNSTTGRAQCEVSVAPAVSTTGSAIRDGSMAPGVSMTGRSAIRVVSVAPDIRGYVGTKKSA